MKILHTADLHLGKILNGYNYIDIQKNMLSQIVEIANQNNIDLIIIAGDVYDRSVPSAEAIDLFDDFLIDLIIKGKKKILLIPGNHDSDERVTFAKNLLDKTGLYMFSSNIKEIQSIVLNDQYGDINFYLLPYIGYYDLKQYLDTSDNYNDCFKRLINNIKIEEDKRNVFIGHGYYTNGQFKVDESDSERELSIGGTDYLDVNVLKDFDVCMFGHLHNRQKVLKDLFRYSGSPLKFSFSEANHKKSVTIYDIKEKNNITFEEVNIVPKNDLVIIEGFFKDIIANENLKKDDLYQFILDDETKLLNPMNAIKEYFPNTLEIRYKEKDKASISKLKEHINYKSKDIIELLSQFYSIYETNSLSDYQKDIAKEVMKNILDSGDDNEN